jgi:hypothetical protein
MTLMKLQVQALRQAMIEKDISCLKMRVRGKELRKKIFIFVHHATRMVAKYGHSFKTSDLVN